MFRSHWVVDLHTLSTAGEEALDKDPTDPMLLRALARQARKLLPCARTEIARRQLRTWIAEFEAQAEAAERDLGRPPRARVRIPAHQLKLS